MTDNQLFALIITAIKAGQQTAGISGIPILQANQPTQQGVNSDPTIYIYKIGDHRFGWPERIDVWNADTLGIGHTETQAYETTFQLSALATQKPDVTNALTASDILNSVAYILQSDKTITTFESQGVGLERVMDLRNPYFINDHARFQASPSFDFVVSHKQIFTNAAQAVETIELDILTV